MGGNYNKSDLSDAILDVKRLLFNNDLTQLKKSKLSAKYVKAKNYNINTNKDIVGGGWDYGIRFYLCIS